MPTAEPISSPVFTHLSLLAAAAALVLAGCGGSGSSRDDDTALASACTVTGSDGQAVVIGSGLPGDPAAPEPSSGFRTGKQVVHAKQFMVSTANPLASKAGCEVLKAGGNAVDAAVAVQMVLGLVEPQSSGIGGGAFMLHYDAATKAVTAYDGRETAPAAATENYLRWVSDSADSGTPQPSARASGRAIGTPGAVRMLGMAHGDHGRKPWGELMQPGITLAQDGFPVSGRMAAALNAAASALARDADAAALYLNADGSARALGSTFTNPAYAATLGTLAAQGPDALYTGTIAQGIVDKIGQTASAADGSAITPGVTTLADLAGYEAKRRAAVCTTYRMRYMVCGMPPPSSGGITVAAAMGVLEHFDLAAHPPTDVALEGGKPSVMAAHLVSEALRLAYADRDAYIADTDFVPLPGGSWHTLLNKPYLAARAALISPTASMGRAAPGTFGNVRPASVPINEAGTSHVTIVDGAGNAVSMTTTVEASLGAYRVTQGFVLNNQLTDFAATPEVDGVPVANRVQPGKRPRSSMAPTLVFDLGADGRAGDFRMATGSPGGTTIIQYVTKTLVAALDWGLNAQQATSMVDFGAANSPTTNVGGEHPAINAADSGADEPLVQGLRALGHTVSVNAQSSGIATIIRVQQGGLPAWAGGADPRREGVVLGH
ncbi:MAG: gamma-glutamyltransferase family protein [Pseudomonadota bacterium]|nr:gamma-glutamyltransferase family protein [Pseudomonadota bacterium]